MSLQFYLLLICVVGLVKSVPPLQQKDEVRVSDIFRRGPESNIYSAALRYRLPTDIIPEHYVVRLRPILDEGPDQFKAPGEVTIRAQCVNATNVVTLHSITIEIDESSVKVTEVDSGTEVAVDGPGEHNTEDETYTIKLGSALEPGKLYNIYISYVAPVAEELRGLYRSKYTDSDGVTRWLATTQFEDIQAKRAFPCFDEPAMKATFDITVAYNQDAGYHVLCNMEIIEETEDPDLPGWKWSTFGTTVKMPTYLIAIVVSDFIAEDAPPDSFGDKPVKTWAQKNLINRQSSGAYSAYSTARDLTFYEEYFNQTYEMPKMDSIGIPDFPFGAMENWGIITYLENYLLYFMGVTTESQRSTITAVVAHEVGHQWFGNMVTMEFWNNVWLKEGFASYVERLCSGALYPEFDTLNTGAIGSLQSSMEFDAGPNTLPLSSEEGGPGQIIYDKGSSIIRMMNAFLTEPTMQKGLRNYIHEKLYGNAVQDDLFRILNAAAQEDGNLPGLTMKEVMDTWTLQTGYPLVKVFKGGANLLLISQERFKYIRLVTTIDPNDLWWIPVTYATSGEPNLPNYKPKLWIPKNVSLTTHSVNSDLNNDWILINPSGYGFYRVLYDHPLSTLIKSQLDRNASVFSSTSRSQLLDDYFTMAYNDYVSIDRALEFTTYLAQEDTQGAWNPVLKHLRTAYRLFSGTQSDFSALKNFFSEKLEGALALIGPEQGALDRGSSVILRANLLDWACGMETETCRAYGSKLFSQWMANPTYNPIPVDIRSVMQCAGVFLGGVAELNFAKDQFSSGNGTERQSWLNAIACSADTEALTELLSNGFENENVFSKAEVMEFFRRMASNSASRNAAFGFLEENFTTILEYLDGNVGFIESLFRTFAQYFNREEQAVMMTDFVEANSAVLPIDALNQHIRTVRNNVNWMSTYGNTMVNWFENH